MAARRPFWKWPHWKSIGHHQHAYEIWNWNSKANLIYAPETMSSTDRRTDRRTDGQGESSIPPPPSNFVGRGYKYDAMTQWRHNGRDGVSNHQSHDCLLNRLFRRKSKKTSKLRVTGLCVWGIHRWPVNSPHKWSVTLKMFPFDDVIMPLV